MPKRRKGNDECGFNEEALRASAGDEFVIIMPGWNKTQAMAMAAEIQARIGARTFLSEVGCTVRLSASFGVAAYPDDAPNMQALLALADQALFRAKGMGRNRILAAGAAA